MNCLISEHIDFHSHILSGIDDGAKNIKISFSMLDRAKKHEISKIAATPHFYPHRDETDSFIRNRDISYQSLCPYSEKIGIEIVCGAEILVYPGIERMKNIEKLTTDGCFLVELPLSASLITPEHIETVKNLKMYERKIILAHPHRYPIEVVENLTENGVFLQLNVTDICEHKGKEKAIEWYKKGFVYALGSDAHCSSSVYKKFRKAIHILTEK